MADQEPASQDQPPEPTRSDDQGKATEQAEHDQSVNGTTPPKPDRHDKPEPGELVLMARGLRASLQRRGRLSIVSGVALAGLAVALGTSSALSVSLLIIGVVMFIVGLMGPRLQGRFALEFGPNGASLEIQTHMAPPGSSRLAAPLAPWKPSPALIASGGENGTPAHDTTTAVLLLAETIEAQGETIELDAKQLKALIGSPHPLS